MNFETFGVERLSLSEEHVLCGPLLRYIDGDYEQGIWRGSCLIVSNTKQAPPLKLRLVTDISQQEQSFEPTNELIDTYKDIYYFWRYELLLPLGPESQTVHYHCSLLQSTYQFHIPAVHENMRFMFYSCSGFSDVDQDVKDRFGEKEAPLWADMLDRHQNMPFHVMLGGGDQLYQDRLINEDFMKPWLEEKDPEKRIAMVLPQEMVNGFEDFYFWNYIKNFGFRDSPVQARAYASIPSVNMWDDHDIIDGWGSYKKEMQEANCFKILFLYASRFYYSFQQHTTLQLAERDGMFRGSKPECNHIITKLGPELGLLCLDARGERTKEKVCSDESYEAVFYALYTRLPRSIRHFMVLTGVPLIYPRLSLFEKAMESAANFNLATIAGKTGALGDVIGGQLNKWDGDPELLDDMNDHWTSALHEKERKTFIESLQSFAKERSVRVSFLGGDVHCCGAGKLYSKDMKEIEEGDPYLMVQIVSSAIVNVPPPQALLTVLNQNSSPITFDGNIEEKMYNLFKISPNGNTRKNKKLMGTRNYCAGYIDKETGKINFWIQCEKAAGVKGTKGYLIDVPKLVFGSAGVQLHANDNKNKNENLNEKEHFLRPVKSPIPAGAGITTPIRPWTGFDSYFDYH